MLANGAALAQADPQDAAAAAPWHVLWTRSHCEQAVHDQLVARGYHPFLPRVAHWSWRAGLRRRISLPLFPGYLFLNDALDRPAHVEVRKTRGLAAILGDGWERPAEVAPAEIEAIRRVVTAGVEVFPQLYLPEGRRVRVVAGPLHGVEGLVLRHRPGKHLVVLSVHLLQRSVAVEVDVQEVVAA